jgi:hypothetical protein
MKKRLTLLAGVFFLLGSLGLGLAQTTVVLNSTYVPYENPKGLVRVRNNQDSYKYVQDDAIAGHSLVKFDIHYIPAGATVTSAQLWFFCQKSYASTIEVLHVTDDSWDPDNPNHTPFPVLWDWGGVDPRSVFAGPSGWKSVDIANWFPGELGTTYLSVKFNAGDARIASPTAWYSNYRPYIVVTYNGASPLGPDLTVNRHDIAFSTMWPVPYEPLTITATVHNVGGTATSGAFWVRFKDDINTIGDVQITNPIPGGDGKGTAQITWYPTEGEHPIEVIADVFNNVPNEIKEDNNSSKENEGNQPYKFEVRGQYNYYAESFENGVNEYDFGTYRRDADQCWRLNGGEQKWYVVRTPSYGLGGPSYDGNWHVVMWMEGWPDNGSVWLERAIPLKPDASLVETSFFAHNSNSMNEWPAVGFAGGFDPDLEADFQLRGYLMHPTWRRHRAWDFLPLDPDRPPGCWVLGGTTEDQTLTRTYYFDLFTVRVEPPRSGMNLATAYNNGAKFVWDGLSYQHLVYMSGDSILYSRSEDGVGDAWSNAEFVGLPLGQHPTIALDIDGYPRAMWRSGSDLYYSKRSASGWSTPFLFYHHPTGHTVETPSLAIDGTYHGHVTWEHKSTTTSEILYGYFNANLTNPPRTISTVQTSASGIRCQNPAIALDGNNPQIVYSRPPGSGQPTDIFQAKKQGSTWPKFNVSSSPSVGSDHPHMAIQNGDIQVVWSEGGGSEIYHRAYVAFFGVWGTITNVSNTSGGSDYPRIVVPGYHVTWMDHSESFGSPAKNPWQTYYTSPATNPGDWNPATNLVPTYEDACYPHAARRQDLIGNTYLDVVHTEGDAFLYTLEVSHKQVGWMNPPGGGEMLLAVNADEAAPGGSRALWMSVPFDVPRDLDVNFAIAGSADNQDGMKLVMDDHDFGWNTPEAWNGQELRGRRKIVRFSEALKAGKHTLELHVSGTPVFKGLRVWHGSIGGGPQSGELALGVPKTSFLAQSFPNPTFGKAMIEYGLAKEGPVKLSIYNALGQVVRELVSENQSPGFHRVEWDGKTREGKQASSGIYFYRLNAGGLSKTNKLVVVR